MTSSEIESLETRARLSSSVDLVSASASEHASATSVEESDLRGRDFTAATRALRGGQLVVDRVFDEVFPLRARRASTVHWTSVEVAMRVATLFAAPPNATILDVGAGVGKFCLVAAAVLPHVRLRGIEHRAHFVAIARDAARKLSVDVDFAHGTLDNEDATSVDGVYLFNPFAENLLSPEDHLDESVELNEERFRRDVERMERFLRAARMGMRVVTYCGWGGEMPPGYRLVRREQRGGTLELWVKSEHANPLANGPAKDATRIGTATLSALGARATAARTAIDWDGE